MRLARGVGAGTSASSEGDVPSGALRRVICGHPPKKTTRRRYGPQRRIWMTQAPFDLRRVESYGHTGHPPTARLVGVRVWQHLRRAKEIWPHGARGETKQPFGTGRGAAGIRVGRRGKTSGLRAHLMLSLRLNHIRLKNIAQSTPHSG